MRSITKESGPIPESAAEAMMSMAKGDSEEVNMVLSRDLVKARAFERGRKICEVSEFVKSQEMLEQQSGVGKSDGQRKELEGTSEDERTSKN